MLIDAVVHAVNEDYDEMAGDFIKLGFLSPGEQWTSDVMLVLCSSSNTLGNVSGLQGFLHLCSCSS